VPTLDESSIVIRFRDPANLDVEFPFLLSMLHDSFMSRRNTIVVPGGRWGIAMELILTPLIKELVS
jgi:phosphoribulokinase